MINIYLDIDGVLLGKDLKPANHAAEFIEYVVTNYPESTYWLTTHCQGDASTPLQHIGHLFDEKTVELMRMIKPTQWETAKTRAIDITKPFIWFDDDIFYEEKQTLGLHGMLDNWVEVNLTKNPNQLKEYIDNFPVPACLTLFDDEKYGQALKVVVENNKAYTTLLQRELRIGFARALNLMIRLEYDGYIKAPKGDFFGGVYLDKIKNSLIYKKFAQ